MRSRLKEKEKAHDKLSREAAQLQDRVNLLQSQLGKAEEEAADLRPENARLKTQLADAKKSLEEETLSRIDLQNQLITSQEGLKFENNLLEQQLNETKMRKQIEISEMDGKLQDQYEEKMQQSLAVSKVNKFFDPPPLSLFGEFCHLRNSTGASRVLREAAF